MLDCGFTGPAEDYPIPQLCQLLSGPATAQDLPDEAAQSVLAAASRHRVIPVLWKALAGGCDLPPALGIQLEGLARARAYSGLKLTAALLQLLDSLASLGIDAFPYKGPYLAQIFYGQVTDREFGDIDVMVARCDVARAAEALLGLGYVPEFSDVSLALLVDFHYECRWFDSKSGLTVELKWGVILSRFGPAKRVGLPFESGSQGTFMGRVCHQPSDEQLFMILVIHGTKHAWDRLQWLWDLKAIIEARPNLCWEKVRQLAARYRAKRALALALRLLSEDLACLCPPQPQVAAGLPGLASLVRQGWRRPLGLNPADRRRFLARVQDSLCDRVAYALRVAFTPTVTELVCLPFTLPFRWMYYPLRFFRAGAEAMGWNVLPDPRH